MEAILKERGQAAPGLESDKWLFCQCPKERQSRVLLLESRANLPRHDGKARTFENFQVVAGTEECFEASKAFAAGGNPHILALTGGVGNGKSHLLEAIGHEIIGRGWSVRYEQVPEFLTRIRMTFNNPDQENPLTCAELATVLLLDDVGLEKRSDWTSEVLTTLVDERYRTGRRLAVATNLTFEDFVRNGNERLGDRLFDTTSGIVRLALNTAPSFRTGRTW